MLIGGDFKGTRHLPFRMMCCFKEVALWFFRLDIKLFAVKNNLIDYICGVNLLFDQAKIRVLDKIIRIQRREMSFQGPGPSRKSDTHLLISAL